MERQLFDWTEWDDWGDFRLCFYKPTLKVDVGDLKAGTTFSHASVDYQHGEMQFYNEDGSVAGSFKLSLSVAQ